MMFSMPTFSEQAISYGQTSKFSEAYKPCTALQPLTSQINKMSGKSVAVATGLGAAATLALAENADAATELAQLAGVDNRIGIIGGLFLPALGWVAFNALGVSNMQSFPSSGC
jgi:hypothetical protein